MIREIINRLTVKHEINTLTEQEIMDLVAQDLPEEMEA